MDDAQLPVVDPSGFGTAPYVRKIVKPWGWERHLVPEHLPYMIKIIHINAGRRLSLQVHDVKHESWTLLSGPGKVIWDDENGQLVETAFIQGHGYTCETGRRHRLLAGEEGDAEIVEVSTPEAGNTFRLEDDFARPHETPEQRSLERRDEKPAAALKSRAGAKRRR